jgi:hypothetical protein
MAKRAFCFVALILRKKAGETRYQCGGKLLTDSLNYSILDPLKLCDFRQYLQNLTLLLRAQTQHLQSS